MRRDCTIVTLETQAVRLIWLLAQYSRTDVINFIKKIRET
jgi:hypothetical protein